MKGGNIQIRGNIYIYLIYIFIYIKMRKTPGMYAPESLRGKKNLWLKQTSYLKIGFRGSFINTILCLQKQVKQENMVNQLSMAF